MNKVNEYVEFHMNNQQRKELIKEYDTWCISGWVDEGVLRHHARLLSEFLYGENTQYGPPITTQMQELYTSVCRYYTDLYWAGE